METLAFTDARLETFRAQIDKTRPRTFDKVVSWYRQNCGVSKGEAIRRAIRSHGAFYNAFRSQPLRRTLEAAGRPVQTMASRRVTQRFVRVVGS